MNPVRAELAAKTSKVLRPVRRRDSRFMREPKFQPVRGNLNTDEHGDVHHRHGTLIQPIRALLGARLLIRARNTSVRQEVSQKTVITQLAQDRIPRLRLLQRRADAACPLGVALP